MNHPLLNMMELLVHNFNIDAAMRREVNARGYGLENPWRFAHPYPGSTNIIIQGDKEKVKETTTTTTTTDSETTTVNKRRCAFVLWALLLLALLLWGLAVWLWLNRSEGTPPPTHDHSDPALLYEVWERDGDGPWKRSTLTVEQLLGRKPK